jgi:hypothetical protein
MGILDLFRGRGRKESFARRFIQEMRKQGDARPLHFDSEDFSIRVGEDPARPDAVHSLHNAYNECERAARAERAAIIARYASNANRSPVPEDYAQARPRLRLMLKDSTYPEIHAQLTFPGSGGELASKHRMVHVPIAADLIACLVDDDVSSVQFIMSSCLATWGVSAERAVADARASMREALDCTLTESDGVYRSQTGDTYDASRLLLDDEIRRLPLRGRPVALVPDRELLLLADSEDPAALARMAELAQERLEEADRPVSGRAVVLEQSGWSAFKPPAEIAAPFENLARLYAHRYYAEQKELLDALHERAGDDIFVATSTLVQREGSDRYLSYATWTRGVRTLLPQVDEIAFFDLDTKTGRMAEWSAARRVLGERMVATDHCPPRWRVSGFPSAEDLLAMGARTL